MNDLLVVRTTKRVRLVRSKLKLIAAHLWLAGERAHPGEIDFAKASAIVNGLWPARRPCRAFPAHKFTRANDFSGLSALLRNSLRFRPSFPA